MTLTDKIYLTTTTAMVALVGGAPLALADTDPAAPLDFLKSARTTASNSNLNTESAATFGGNIATIIAIACGVVGLGLAGVSGKKLYDAVSNENSRESVGGSLGGVVLGALLTIIGVIVGVVTNNVASSS